MDDVSIIELEGMIFLVSPYAREFPKEAKRIGGLWDSERKAWRFDARDKSRVMELAREFWGYEPGDDAQGVTVRIDPWRHLDEGVVRFAGRRIAWRPSRDAEVRLSKNVVVAEGRFMSSGGSASSPSIGIEPEREPAVLEIRDLPATALSIVKQDTYLLVGGSRQEMLIQERERLEKRLREITSELEELQG
jgi:hypothetical protein